MRRFAPLFLLALGVACSATDEVEPKAAKDDDERRGSDDDDDTKAEDAPKDGGGVADDDDVPPGPFQMAPGLANAALPAKVVDVSDIGPPGFVDMGSAAILTGGLLRVFYERFDDPFTNGGLLLTTSTDGRTFSPPVPWGPQRRSFEVSPSFASYGDGEGLSFYFESANGLGTKPELFRAVVPKGKRTLSTPQAMLPIAGIDSILSWPKFEPLADRRIGLAFRDRDSRPMVAFSDNGQNFGPPVLVGPETGGAMPAIGSFGVEADGAYPVVYTYQTQAQAGQAEPMIAWFRILASPGGAWKAPTRITTASGNVHDTTVVTRRDGNVDLYYIYPTEKGFSLFRRSLAPSGSLGAEQRLTTSEVVEPSKPSVTRLGEQGLHVRFARITIRASGGEPSEQRLSSILLTEDAPAPP